MAGASQQGECACEDFPSDDEGRMIKMVAVMGRGFAHRMSRGMSMPFSRSVLMLILPSFS
jgi:hypothetical protein